MTRKKKRLFLRRNIAYLMNKSWDEACKKASENPNRIITLELPGLENYCEVKPANRICYSVSNHSRKHIKNRP